MVGETTASAGIVDGNYGLIHLRVTNNGLLMFAGNVREGSLDHAVATTLAGLEPMVRKMIVKALESATDHRS